MHRLLCGAVLAVVFIEPLTGCSPSHSMPPAQRAPMNPRGGPTIVHGAAYGVTSGGGILCRRVDGTIEAAGCGTIYRFEPDGRFTIVRSFQGAQGPFGTLAATPGSEWLYGTTSSGSVGAAGPILYRISPDGLQFEVLQRASDYSEVTVGKTGAYVFANDFSQSATLEKLLPSGKVERLATFPGLSGVLPPLVRRDGSIAIILNDIECGVEVSTVEGHIVRTLYEGRTERSSENRCFHSGDPQWGLAESDAGLLSTNAHEIVRLGPDGSRTTLIRLPTTLGNFVGNIVPHGGEIFALTASGSDKDPICMRLLRIRGQGRIDIVHAFEREKRRCLPNADLLFPRLAVDGAHFVISTAESPACPNSIVKEPATCGSIVWSRADGSEIAAHDFVQLADRTDGAQRNLTTALGGVEGELRLTFLRDGPPAPFPFTLDADGLTLVMKRRVGRSYRIRSSGHGIYASQITPSEGVAWSAHGQQIVTLDFPMPPDLPAGVYTPELGPDPTLRDSAGATLGVRRELSDTITTTSDAELRALRKRYLGRYVFGLGAREAACVDGTTEPSAIETPRLRIVAIKRKVGTVEWLPLGDYSGFSFDPLLVVLQKGQATNVAPRGSRRSCSTATITRSGTWDFERFFSLHQPPDPRWPARFRTAHIPMVGMTHAMVAAVWGYPRNVDTVAELVHENEWTYDVFDTVRFRGDRVSAVIMKNQP